MAALVVRVAEYLQQPTIEDLDIPQETTLYTCICPCSQEVTYSKIVQRI